jgi:hypothetical protein
MCEILDPMSILTEAARVCVRDAAARSQVPGYLCPVAVLERARGYLRTGRVVHPGRYTRYFFEEAPDGAEFLPKDFGKYLDLQERGY